MIAADCYLLSPTSLWERSLRRYSARGDEEEIHNDCSGPLGYHDAEVPLNCENFSEQPPWGQPYFRDDTRWPKKCRACGYTFAQEDKWQVFFRRFYQRKDTNELLTLLEAPYGALWHLFDDELEQEVIMLKTPLGDINLHKRMYLLQGTVSGESPKVTCSKAIEGTRIHDGNSFRLWVRNGTLIYGLPRSVP